MCPCHSQKTYDECCKKYHEGSLPVNAVDLMRSRYAAYALNLATYIIQTTDCENPEFEPDFKKWQKQIEAFSKSTEFCDLKILDFKQEGDQATVSFYANLKQMGQDMSFTEKSTFRKINGKWLYLKGEVS
jgi:SEC-C motif-containing protein